MNEEKPNTNKTEEQKITVELKPSQLFQLHLSVLNRIGDVQIKFCNAFNEEEQNSAEQLLMYLQKLDLLLLNLLKGDENHGEK